MRRVLRSTTTLLAIAGTFITVLVGVSALVIQAQPVTQIVERRPDVVWMAITLIAGVVIGLASPWIAKRIRRFPSAPRVFLSYSRPDESSAYEIYSRLQQEGAKVWLDQEEIEPGQNWQLALDEAISDSDSMIVLVSGSSSSWLPDEVDRAKVSDVRIIPVLLEEAQIPEHLFGIQYIDFTKNKEEGMDDLIESST